MSKKHGAKGIRDSNPKKTDILMRSVEDGLIPKNPSAAIPGTFYHGMIANSGNASLPRKIIDDPDAGIFITPNYVTYLDPTLVKKHKRVENHTIADLRTNPSFGALTPMVNDYIYNASYLRRGGYHIFDTIGDKEVQLSDSEENAIIERSEIEIKFETCRRKVSPNSVSRLECFFLAKNLENIKRMFDYNPNLVTFEVKIIESLNCTKVDSRWFEEFCNTHINKCIEYYWSGQPYDKDTDTWEYLVDGAIKVVNQDAAKTALEYQNNSIHSCDDTWE